ncbi:hypothetical protein PsorP6_017766 [Peronosclerospora sorghi]|uniref:Uncharacterized protein n=1 Tax=Peronosclerospora sorghi TaxID=230839 RepID=A0ACC0WLM6_9STRA|nr:hypothetical protein PsorP6_017766 [Peronosclerospora sorghi]
MLEYSYLRFASIEYLMLIALEEINEFMFLQQLTRQQKTRPKPFFLYSQVTFNFKGSEGFPPEAEAAMKAIESKKPQN